MQNWNKSDWLAWQKSVIKAEYGGGSNGAQGDDSSKKNKRK